MKFLIIQTAFTGDVILATSVAEKLVHYFPKAQIDFLIRKGNESLFNNHPFIREVIVWDKKRNKFSNLFRIMTSVRKEKYDVVINLHRFGSSGLITALSGAKETLGFDKNPFSFLFTKKFRHEIGSGKHEIERNHELIKHLTDNIPAKPTLYPNENDFKSTFKITNPKPPEASLAESGSQIPIRRRQVALKADPKSPIPNPYICIAPASVWYTKQFPKEKWIELINHLLPNTLVYLIGSKDDRTLCDSILSGIQNRSPAMKSEMVKNLAGTLSFLESAALIKNASMNYVNDSAPLHMASAINAPVTAIFCSTIPRFGFGPLSDHFKIAETKIELDCRPCGLHGYHSCPKGHFKCALTIEVKDIL